MPQGKKPLEGELGVLDIISSAPHPPSLGPLLWESIPHTMSLPCSPSPKQARDGAFPLSSILSCGLVSSRPLDEYSAIPLVGKYPLNHFMLLNA